MDGRIPTALSLYAFGTLGVFLVVAPWTPLWTQAVVVWVPRGAESWVLSGWTRGAISGLGVVDVGLALASGLEFWRGEQRGSSSSRKKGGVGAPPAES